MNAGHIVNALIETGEDLTPEEFMDFFGKRRLGGFHFVSALEYGGRYRTTPGALLVYTNNGDGTRDFIGVVRELTMSPGWIPLACANPRPDQATELIRLHAGKPVATQGEAADQVLDAYEKIEAEKKGPQQEAEELGGGVDPAEFLAANPDLFVHYEFVPTISRDIFSVKRWEGGTYYYIGTVIYRPARGVWYAQEMAPVGRFHTHTMVPTFIRSNKYEAAADLWDHYRISMPAT